MPALVVAPLGGLVAVAYLAVAALAIVAWAKILSKAGYSCWWVLIGLVPVVNVVMFFVFAFGRWPALEPQRGA